VVGDITILKPDKYGSLLKETLAALKLQIEHECADEIRESLSDLILLLEDNTAMSAFLDQSRNLMRKA